jgi:5-methylcytosine-specific restriction endonuclease McrA
MMPTIAESIAHIIALRAVEPKKKGRSKDFYASVAWKRLRYQVLRESNGCCVVCGRSAKDGIVLHVDHIVSLSKDWSKRLDKNNLQVMCSDDNMSKSNTDSIDWRRQDAGVKEEFTSAVSDGHRLARRGDRRWLEFSCSAPPLGAASGFQCRDAAPLFPYGRMILGD